MTSPPPPRGAPTATPLVTARCSLARPSHLMHSRRVPPSPPEVGLTFVLVLLPRLSSSLLGRREMAEASPGEAGSCNPSLGSHTLSLGSLDRRGLSAPSEPLSVCVVRGLGLSPHSFPTPAGAPFLHAPPVASAQLCPPLPSERSCVSHVLLPHDPRVHC